MAKPKEYLDSTDKKVCKTCKEPKFLDEFHRSRTGRGGRGAECALCANERNAKDREKRKSKETDNRLRRPDHVTNNSPDLLILRKAGVGSTPPAYWDLTASNSQRY